MDVDSKEDYFIELILSRHARKLLGAHSLRDLGCFAAHLDFSLPVWLARERLRAATVEDFPCTLQELHKEFQWPYPSHYPSPSVLNTDPQDSPTASTGSLFSPASTIRGHTPKSVATPTDNELNPEVTSNGGDDSPSASLSSKRGRRPPNLDLSPPKSRSYGHQHTSVTLEPNQSQVEPQDCDETDREHQSSTPTRESGSVSEKVSLVMKNNLCK